MRDQVDPGAVGVGEAEELAGRRPTGPARHQGHHADLAGVGWRLGHLDARHDPGHLHGEPGHRPVGADDGGLERPALLLVEVEHHPAGDHEHREVGGRVDQGGAEPVDGVGPHQGRRIGPDLGDGGTQPGEPIGMVRPYERLEPAGLASRTFIERSFWEFRYETYFPTI